MTYVVELDQVWEVVDDVNKPQFSPTTGFASYTDAIFAKQAANSADGGYKYFFAAENNGYELPATNELPKPGYFLFVDNTKATDIFAKQYDATYDNTLQYALKSDVGVYTNTKLYAATSLTASKSEWKEIATINQATGEITYVQNSTSEFFVELLWSLQCTVGCTNRCCTLYSVCYSNGYAEQCISCQVLASY